MNAHEAIGYLASLPVLAAFGVRGMVALRPPAIAGNCRSSLMRRSPA